jgi:hypothetical protein
MREDKAAVAEKTPVELSEDTPVPVTEEAESSPSPETVSLRRSTRSHKPPEHLKDYVCT